MEVIVILLLAANFSIVISEGHKKGNELLLYTDTWDCNFLEQISRHYNIRKNI